MKISVIPSIIAVGLSLLFGYAVFSVAGNDDYAVLAFIVGCICFLVENILAFGVSYDDSRKGVSLQALSVLAVFVSAIAQFAFAICGITLSYYIITSGLLLLIYLLAFYGILNSEQA